MKIVTTKTQSDTIYYLAKTVRRGDKVKTVRLENLGKHSELIKDHEDPLAYLKSYAKKKTLEEKAGTPTFKPIKKVGGYLKESEARISRMRTLNIGYFFLQDIYHGLELKSFFKTIKSGTKITYDPNLVTRFLTYARILDPKSKSGTYDTLDTYYEKPKFKEQDMFKTMDLISTHLEAYQRHLYDKSKSLIQRNTTILYYDITNYFFETKLEDDMRRYGNSKEHRPNPIVQMGLFMDGDGIPLYFQINPGSDNENKHVIAMEKTIIKDFKVSDFIYVADAGCNSNDIRLFNTFSKRDFIVTQSIKTLKDDYKKVIFEDDGWYYYDKDHALKMTTKSSIMDSDTRIYFKSFTINNPKDIGLHEDRRKKTDFHQRLIVTFSKKHEKSQQKIREKQVQRAYKLIKEHRVDTVKGQDVKRFVTTSHQTSDGKHADQTSYDLDLERIMDEAKYDGLYGLVTSMFEEDVRDILQASRRRWEIEDCFRVMKTNFKARPVYHYRDRRIIAHFAICFLALLVYRILEKKLSHRYTVTEIITTLKNMNVYPSNEAVFESLYTDSELLRDLVKTFGKNLDLESYYNTALNKAIKK
jgi:transposase